MPSWISISDSEYGRLAETLACWWLRLRGYSVVARNVRVLGREVDVVAAVVVAAGGVDLVAEPVAP